MADIKEYCHYALSLNNRKSVFAAAPTQYITKQSILDDFNQTFGYTIKRWPRFNKNLIDALWWAFKDSDLLRTNKLNKDAKILYRRCLKGLQKIDVASSDSYEINYCDMFEILADYIWLLSSQRYCAKRNERQTYLIDKFSQIHVQMRQILKEWDYQREEDVKECSVIEEALRLKRRVFCGTSSDDRIRWYLTSGMQNDELQDLIDEKKRQIGHEHYLYFAIIATSVRYEEVRSVLL
ncbi:MAG: hypothetical protein K0Q87_492 [Neobacillus sp.]|nr:hypothetical protein [Neobacillus sp.]